MWFLLSKSGRQKSFLINPIVHLTIEVTLGLSESEITDFVLISSNHTLLLLIIQEKHFIKKQLFTFKLNLI